MSFAHSTNVSVDNSIFYDVAIVIQNHYYQVMTDEELRWAIASWLSDLNFQETQNDIFAERTPGTGQWLLESQAFEDWVSGKSEILWCPGIREIVTLFIDIGI